MTIFQSIIADKTLKLKAKTDALSEALAANPANIDELLSIAQKSRESIKATCIEAIEFATKKDPSIATQACLDFVTETLLEEAGRVKWESAKVIGNIAKRFPNHLDKAIGNLLINTEHAGPVVRWSAAFALGEIYKMKSKHNETLLPAIEAIIAREEKNSVKKVYSAALKAS